MTLTYKNEKYLILGINDGKLYLKNRTTQDIITLDIER